MVRHFFCTRGQQKNNKMDGSQEWINLQDEKSFSRLLYTNPVCFLTTWTPTSRIPRWNVMVVSWLSATNNNGRFMMSMNKRRFTNAAFTTRNDNSEDVGVEFVLSVPVAGMEELVLNVGKTSGRWGSSKFLQDYSNASDVSCQSVSQPRKSKRKKFTQAVQGLKATKLGASQEKVENEDEPFAIQGTVAHLKCRSYAVPTDTDGNDLIDDDHDLILAQVHEAYVDTNYWDEQKKLFRPQASDPGALPPYLTFFGSQTFGYVNSVGMEHA